ncbi:unnamed protein product [Heterobilharzia americana]|nr:unnamed protein product [Heterobilharzia americana]
MMSHYHGRQSMRSPQQLSIMSDHEIMLSNENLNFNFDEIRRELANLGVTGLTDKQLSCLKHDLDLMISKEKQLLNCLPRPKSSHSDYYSERIQQSTYTHDDGEYNHAHDNSCYTNDNNNRRKKVLYSSNKSLPYLSNSSLSSSQSSCFSVTSEEFSNYNTGDNYNVNNNNNIGEAKMSKRQQNRTHLDKYVVKKTSTGQTNKKFTEMDRPANHHFMHKNEQSVSSNTLSSLTNIVPSSSGRHIIPKPENKQRVPITDNLSQITFRSPKPSNLSSEKVERSKIVENKTSTTTHDNYRRKSSFNCTCEQEDQHSATNPLLGVDVLSATKYDVRTSYLLSNDEVNDNNEEEDETPILSSSQLLSDEVRHYHEQQEQQQTTKQEHSLYQQQNNLQSGNKSQGVQHQSVSMKHYQKDPNAEFNVQSVHPPMLHNGFTLSSLNKRVVQL